MKTMKPAILLVFGILAVLLAAGCSNPIAAPGDAPAAGVGTDPGPDDSFTVSFTLGQNGNVRSVAGPTSDRIQIYGAKGLRNYVQLIVVDEATKKVVEFAEERKLNAGTEDFTLHIGELYRDKTYSFLLLMGHWGHNGSYVYDTRSPTLLATGLVKNQMLNATGDTTVTITMYALVVDTKFQSTTGVTIEPPVTNGKPGPARLPIQDSTDNWKAIWTVQRKNAGSNGLSDLVWAQKVIDVGAGNDLLVKASKAYRSGVLVMPTANYFSATENSFRFQLRDEDQVPGSSKYVNFELEYVPFNLQDIADWGGKTSAYFNPMPPVWSIRNGLNNDVQNGNTDFTNFGNSSFPSANANGAVRYVVEPLQPPPPPGPNNLIIENGAFEGSPNTTAPTIKFDTSGYTGTADVWYAVVAPDGTPQTQDYTWVDSVTVGVNYTETIAVSSTLLTAGYDVYVTLAQGGKTSDEPVVIKARMGTGNVLVPWTWGE